MAAAYLAVQFRDKYLLMWGMLCLMLAVGVPTLPPVFRFLVRLVRAEKYLPEVGEKLLRLGYGTILWGWIIMPISWVMLGISYWATLEDLASRGSIFGVSCHDIRRVWPWRRLGGSSCSLFRAAWHP